MCGNARELCRGSEVEGCRRIWEGKVRKKENDD